MCRFSMPRLLDMKIGSLTAESLVQYLHAQADTRSSCRVITVTGGRVRAPVRGPGLDRPAVPLQLDHLRESGTAKGRRVCLDDGDEDVPIRPAEVRGAVAPRPCRRSVFLYLFERPAHRIHRNLHLHDGIERHRRAEPAADFKSNADPSPYPYPITHPHSPPAPNPPP